MKEQNSMVKAVFVSVPMKGLDEALIKRRVMLAKRTYLRRKGMSAKDVWFYDNLTYEKEFEKEYGYSIVGKDNPKPSLVYLGAAMVGLSYCDEAVFGKGWKEANGCNIEHEVCVRYGIPIIDCEDSLKVKVDKKTGKMTKVK